ncbi:response regulator [Fimbriiglobus ruber]|uniref:Serine/threonine protein kinase PrkC, regulator of stationary phase n=1 Tax=Fimbriiglobus ruber TaxID=1908690 RepID=A0A225E3E2_9BACT|nr:response regulator [Fimbriiglobus ruber]OWK45318.1 Serine/threonine protein kinase PrkC, regulator of stationary phase [Fimbriiglobus ruber]
MRTILYTEDNKINRDMLSRRLERKGYRVLTAENGSDGVAQATAHKPDLILMDMSMPVMDGWEATRRLKGNPETKPIPVIALTAHAMLGDRERAMEAGCDDYEMKPIDLDRLLIKIEALISDAAAAVAAVPQILSLLIVDDNKLNREVLGRRLKRPEYKILEARSGREALDVVQKGGIDLVLLDSMMPEMTGLEVLQVIRAEYTIIDLPVIMVTAKEQTEEVVAALEAGANDYVTKPLNFPVVLARIHTQLALKRAHLSGRSAAAPAAAPAPAKAVRPPATTTKGTVGQSSRLPEPSAPATRATPSHRAVVWKSTPSAPPPAPPAPPNSRPPSGRPSSPPHRTPDSRTTFGSSVGQAETWNSPPAGSEFPNLSGYQILGELGRGGMGVVYKALHERMNRMVAIKVIDRKHWSNPEATRRFYREVQAAAQLSHPNIVLAYDAGEYDDSHYFVMEYVEGVDLATLVKQRGPLSVEEACHCVRQIARGLQHAHEQGLVHRDIKPTNLLATWSPAPLPPGARRNGPRTECGPPESVGRATVKVLDMGLALLHQPSELTPAAAVQTQNNRVVGTADYMAPEQWMNAHKVDIRADLYSLGCTFYYLLAGEVPFPSAESMEKMLKHHLDEPAPLATFRRDVPPHVADVIGKLMAKKPEHRFQTPNDVHDALAAQVAATT